MRAAMARSFPPWIRDPEIYAVVISSASDRAFCAGGDLRELTDWGRNRRADAVKSLAEEYALNWQLECFFKPTVSLIDGVTMGSGRGHLALRHASRRGRALSLRDARDRHRSVPRRRRELGLRPHARCHRHVPGADRPIHRAGGCLPARVGDALHPGRALRRNSRGPRRRRHRRPAPGRPPRGPGTRRAGGAPPRHRALLLARYGGGHRRPPAGRARRGGGMGARRAVGPGGAFAHLAEDHPPARAAGAPTSTCARP